MTEEAYIKYSWCLSLSGFCLEKVAPPSTSKYRAAEREENIISCYESAGDLAILYFQDHDKNMPASTSSSSLSAVETGVGPILDRAIQQSPIMLIKNG